MCRRVSAARHAIPRGWGNCSGRFARVCALEQTRSEEHTSELQSRLHLVCRLLLEKKNRDDNEHSFSLLRHLPPVRCADLVALPLHRQLTRTEYFKPTPQNVTSHV